MKSIKWFNKLIVTGLFLLSTIASADIIVTDELEGEGYSATFGFPVINTVDIWSFSTSGGTVSFDIFAYGFNGSVLDSMVWLFKEDGDLDSLDMLGQIDDDPLTLFFGDGSTSKIDSYLTSSIDAGNYLFAIGWCCEYGPSDILDGVQGGTPDDLVNSTLTESYAYQLTIKGEIDTFGAYNETVLVPEPAILALFSLGLLALTWRRKNFHN
ncbi:MAG: PEP-CTERM sorting domain-containing protein [Gammaproteobacteria bacterium]|nr:PEP-CTERM sorting domain-containing protein [Gammaproteobacteria bacterium]